ncbi:MAG: hypothetical protein GY833_22615 [Aestuariibacter sp.]|nr:hypothetical protein [Aestuariibacter sp.]
MYVNKQLETQLKHFDDFTQLMKDMGMECARSAVDSVDEVFSQLRKAIVTKKDGDVRYADFKHPNAEVWLQIEAETPLYSIDPTKVRILVSTSQYSHGTRENPFRPLGKVSTLKKRIDDLVESLSKDAEREARAQRFMDVNTSIAENMALDLTGEKAEVREEKGYQSITLNYRAVSVKVGLSMFLNEGDATKVSLSLGFNSKTTHKTLTLKEWVRTVDQFYAMGLLG